MKCEKIEMKIYVKNGASVENKFVPENFSLKLAIIFLSFSPPSGTTNVSKTMSIIFTVLT